MPGWWERSDLRNIPDYASCRWESCSVESLSLVSEAHKRQRKSLSPHLWGVQELLE